MNNKTILIRFGDLVLKGKNKLAFIKQVRKLIKEKLKDLDVEFDFRHDRIYIMFNEENKDQVEKRLSYVSGIQSYSYVYTTTNDLEDILKTAIEIIENEVNEPTTFKIETKRADKLYPLTSQEITQQIAPRLLKHFDNRLKVDVKNPKMTLHIELRKEATYLYFGVIKAMGGFPVGIGGKGLLMLSGGIDSPVSGYLAIKQGITIELMHYESTPLTPLESVQKVIDLAKKLSYYMPNNKIKLHLVPFTKIHEEILKNVSDPYIINIMRRMMYRLAERYANQKDILCIINGESVGQVASQTLQSIKTVENVTNIPILRPLITYDKQDIINISKKIDAFDISIRPFNDCCSIYVPKRPIIKPTIVDALKEEEKFDYNPLLEEAISGIQTIYITPDLEFNIADFGFDVKEAIQNFKEEGKQKWLHLKIIKHLKKWKN